MDLDAFDPWKNFANIVVTISDDHNASRPIVIGLYATGTLLVVNAWLKHIEDWSYTYKVWQTGDGKISKSVQCGI